MAQFALDANWGIPVPASGTAAVVFKATVSGTEQALRFFIREDVSSKRRYCGLAEHVGRLDLRDCVAEASWIDDAIAVNNSTWPLIQMSWVEGTALDSYVQQALRKGDTEGLRSLAEQWRALVRRLQVAQFAHGDLQHANVLIGPRGALRLVDLDGSWIGAFAGEQPPAESGHPNYQLPQRRWGPWMDTFPGLVIYGALLGLSKYPRELAAFNNGDNLLFCREDFRAPFRTAVWDVLDTLPDPELRAVADRIRDCCAAGNQQLCSLEQRLATAPTVGVLRPSSAPSVTPWWLHAQPPALPPNWFAQRSPSPVQPVTRPVRPARPVRSTPSKSRPSALSAVLVAVIVGMIVWGVGSTTDATDGSPAIAALLAALVTLVLMLRRGKA